MARARGQSFGDGLKAPHTVSLKVLRLSRPSLQYQYPLPHSATDHDLSISPKASLANPTAELDDNFIITPVLTLPQSFQSAYVGEEFSCTLCANNELLQDDHGCSVSGVRIVAEMQTPSNPTGVILNTENTDDGTDFGPGESIQTIVKLHLSEEGNHVLSVTVTYTETQLRKDGGAASGRVRTFRKLYQFVAQPLVGVRTKAGDLVLRSDGLRRYALEAQLENLGERSVALEAVTVTPKHPFKATSLNWDIFDPGSDHACSPILNPRDVMQVAFLLEEQAETDDASRPAKESKLVLGQLNIQWRSAMGDRGSLSTGWLTGRKR